MVFHLQVIIHLQKYNKFIDVIKYTDEEYKKYLVDPTKEETDQLFDMCEWFDLRFIVIANRFPSSKNCGRTEESFFIINRLVSVGSIGLYGLN
ncbi:SWR1-complex 4 isoform X1 [Olea europaea subsp. europaea]|uniref:SWR1-complex 4 isoform X1 n=1 Tax=Olea europaea subsp. europaea TaxID=158383 RepID=A0A8S0UQ64_OLEEU|nr:SWR1-complex 4 isoform X1 [Olea europaea subsp. europaea]